MEKIVAVRIDGKEIKVKAGTPLSEIVSGEKPCGGHGRCGKCTVIAKGALSPLTDAERELLTDQELARGVSWLPLCAPI